MQRIDSRFADRPRMTWMKRRARVVPHVADQAALIYCTRRGGIKSTAATGPQASPAMNQAFE
ncbi:hypothetical protein DIE19_33275 [Burkholderia sp. Bp9126]|nr:hypothetical protein DIE19_33275 [Burkholderia sp. Bp9126]